MKKILFCAFVGINFSNMAIVTRCHVNNLVTRVEHTNVLEIFAIYAKMTCVSTKFHHIYKLIKKLKLVL